MPESFIPIWMSVGEAENLRRTLYELENSEAGLPERELSLVDGALERERRRTFQEMQAETIQQPGVSIEGDPGFKELLSAIKVWRNATESRLRLLNGREALDTMIPADRALIEAAQRIEAEERDDH